MPMRFKHLIKIIVCIQVSFSIALINGDSFAQQNKSIEYWLQITGENPSDALAWFNIGVLYEKGQGVPANHNKAQQFYTKSINLGYAPAMFNLGSIYAQKKDYSNAKFWWEKAATKNVPEAQYNLATLYEKGWGVKQDPEKAALWYQRAAETAMQKYLDLYKHSKEKLKEQSASTKTSISVFDQFNIIPLAVAATDSESASTELEKIDQNADLLQLAQADSVNQQQSDWPWVYSQPEENFTIQLFATKQENKTAKFIQQYALTEQAKVIPAIVKGTKYYKVILGSFTEWNDAAVEIGALPQDLRDERPWVRKFNTLYPEKPEAIETTISAFDEESQPQEQAEQVVDQVVQNNSQESEPTVSTELEQAAEEVQTEAALSDEIESAQADAAETEPATTGQAVQSQQQTASLDKKEPEIKSRMPEKESSGDESVDDVFTLYAKKQLNSSGLSGQVKQRLQAGLEFIKAQNHAQGFEQLAPLADAGLPEAQFRLSLLYAEGKGVGLDLNKAFEYAKLSGEQGHPYGQRLLAEFYENGVGTTTNAGLATYWRQTAEDNIKKLEEL